MGVSDEALAGDLDLIEHSLLRWRNHANASRFGGLAAEWEEARKAVEALARIRAWMARPQLKLFDGEEK